nr:MAG TPA: hypothetical protein [Caudoviricetes sp.]
MQIVQLRGLSSGKLRELFHHAALRLSSINPQRYNPADQCAKHRSNRDSVDAPVHAPTPLLLRYSSSSRSLSCGGADTQDSGNEAHDCGPIRVAQDAVALEYSSSCTSNRVECHTPAGFGVDDGENGTDNGDRKRGPQGGLVVVEHAEADQHSHECCGDDVESFTHHRGEQFLAELFEFFHVFLPFLASPVLAGYRDTNQTNDHAHSGACSRFTGIGRSEGHREISDSVSDTGEKFTSLHHLASRGHIGKLDFP